MGQGKMRAHRRRAQTLTRMREWIADTGTVARRWPDRLVIHAVQKGYKGGLRQFVLDGRAGR